MRITTPDIRLSEIPPFHTNGVTWSDEGMYPKEREERYINRHECARHACNDDIEPLDWDEIHTPGVEADKIAHRYYGTAKPEGYNLDLKDITPQQVNDWFDDVDDETERPDEVIPEYINNI